MINSALAVKECRVAERFCVKWRAVFIDAAGKPVDCEVKNISTGGACLMIEKSIRCGESIDIRIKLPMIDGANAAKAIHVNAKVVYVIHDNQTQQFRTGVEFAKYKEEDILFLENRLRSNHRLIVAAEKL